MNTTRLRTAAVVLASFALFLLSTSWLLAPFVNHTLQPGTNQISDYEAPGMPYADWFRLADALAAGVLAIIVLVRRRPLRQRFTGSIVGALLGIAGLQLIDTVAPITCTNQAGQCTILLSPSSVIHIIESVCLGLLLFVLAVYAARKNHKLLWLPVTYSLLQVLGLLAHFFNFEASLPLQSATIIVTTYLTWWFVLGDLAERLYLVRLRPLLATLIGMSATLSIVESVTHISHHTALGQLAVGGSTAWLSQHALVVSMAMLYLSRAIWQGSASAWKIVTFLTFTEIIRSTAAGRYYSAVLTYLLLFVSLLLSRHAFTLQHTLLTFGKRLRRSLVILVITTIVVSLFSISFHYAHTRQWRHSSLSADRIIARTLLLTISTDQHDPLRIRLFYQSLNAIGLAMYIWLFLGLFSPQLLRGRRRTDPAVMANLLASYSASSEDYFKLWPTDKIYWTSPRAAAAIAYKPQAGFMVALADPVGSPRARRAALSDFRLFARQHGYKAAWLMVSDKSRPAYETAGYSLRAIGSAAVIDVENFAAHTIRGKWWRWKRNKATRAGLTYERLLPPQTSRVLTELQTVSDAWLGSGNHEERGFALGYFDASELSRQTIHCLRDAEGHIVAFANELPRYAAVSTATIDLMRARPEYADAMAFLLSETICSFRGSTVGRFDLGFVPLARVASTSSGRTLTSAVRKALGPVFSSHGLEQFKDKFDPVWQPYYIAFDGDTLDIPPLLKAIVECLRLKP